MSELIVHCKKKPYDIYCGRGSIWGNPFVEGKDGSRADVIEKYRNWIQEQPHLMKKLPSLKGKVLGCWCAPKPCHCDVLVELSNGIPCFECDGFLKRVLLPYKTAKGVVIENVPMLKCQKCGDGVIGDEGNQNIELTISRISI